MHPLLLGSNALFVTQHIEDLQKEARMRGLARLSRKGREVPRRRERTRWLQRSPAH